MPKPIRITSIGFSRTADGGLYNCNVAGLEGLDCLTCEVRSSTGHQHPASTASWVALGLLLPAMRAGQDLRIDGCLPALLLHFLRSDVQALLLNFDPSLQRIQIDAQVAADPPRAAMAPFRVGTGFSAGIDSFSALGTFKSTGMHPALAVTDLFTFEVGAFGSGRAAASLFDAAAERVADFASLTCLQHHTVQSNLASAYGAGEHNSFVRTHTLRNASAAALFENELDAYLYASAYSYAELDLRNADTMGSLDAILLPMISTERMRMISAGAGIDRVEKTRPLSDDPHAQMLLDVCTKPAAKRLAEVGPGKNCSRCVKCYRTMATLDALGELDAFSAVFDVAHYRAHRGAALTKLKRRAAQGSTLDRAVVDLLQDAVSRTATL